MSIVFLELTKLRPLDVMLTSSDELSSFVIKGATSIRGLRLAHYSHAALMLSPGVCVEALTKPGIVCTDLSEPAPLFFRWVEGKLTVFASLKGVDNAAVFRHRSVTRELSSGSLSDLRSLALEALAECYLMQYSLLINLVRPIVRLPPRVESFLARVTPLFEGRKPEPGPFCSELVCRLLGAVVKDATPYPDRVAPSDLSWDTESLEELENVVRLCEPDDLPGFECDDDFSSGLSQMLEADLSQQEFQKRLLQAMSVIPAILADGVSPEDPSIRDALEMKYSAMREEARHFYVDELQHSLYQFQDRLWEWMHRANVCKKTCPETRIQKFARHSAKDPVKGPSLFKTSNELFWERIENWNGEPCADVRSCVTVHLSRLREEIQVSRDARLEEIAERGDAALKEMRSASSP